MSAGRDSRGGRGTRVEHALDRDDSVVIRLMRHGDRSAVPSGAGPRTVAFVPFVVLIAAAGVGIRMLDVGLAQWNVGLGQSDSSYYYLQADLLAHGHWFVNPFTFAYYFGRIRPSAAHPPLFTLTLAGADVLWDWSVNATRLLCCVIGGVGVFMVGLLGREVGGRRVGLLAAAIAAVYPVWWITDGLILSEVLYVPLVAGLLVLAFRLWHRPRIVTAVAIGVVGGLAAYTRSEGLLLLIVVAAAVLFLNRSLTLRRRAQLLGATVLAAALTIAPWIAFNAARFNHPVYMSTNNGATIADSNCPQTYFGSKVGSFVTFCHTPKVREPGDESDVSSVLVKVGLRYARNHASRVPAVMAARVGRVWGVFHPVQTIDLDSYGKWSHGDSRLMVFSFYGVAVAGVVGLVVLRRREITIVPFVAAIVAVTAGAALFYGIIRFRVPGDVSAVVLAALAFDAALNARSCRCRTRGAPPKPR
jgi:4-amino-4-deoxy-L-arabinose transferase-like glycosyltransferase